MLYEDGKQTRDFSFVEDSARANLLAATSDALDGQAVNVGSGRATSIRAVARMLCEALSMPIEPMARGEFRPGEMRHLLSAASRIQAASYRAEVDLEPGIQRHLDWIRSQGDVRDYFAAAERLLREHRIVHQAR